MIGPLPELICEFFSDARAINLVLPELICELLSEARAINLVLPELICELPEGAGGSTKLIALST